MKMVVLTVRMAGLSMTKRFIAVSPIGSPVRRARNRFNWKQRDENSDSVRGDSVWNKNMSLT